MKILITGICGFVGSTLAKAWRTAHPDDEIVGLDNFIRAGSRGNIELLRDLGIEIVEGDVRSREDLAKLGVADWVLDAAANPSVLAGVDGKTSSYDLLDHNLIGTINLLEFCRENGAGFTLLSTSRVYSIPPLSDLKVEVENAAFTPVEFSEAGFSEHGLAENFSTEPPLSLYGNSKRCSEFLALEYGLTFEFPVWINRCGVLAGEGQFGKPDQGIFSFWINSYLRKKTMKYIGFDGNGHQVRDCMHPRDLLPVIEKQMAEPLESEKPRIANFSGGIESAMSLNQLSLWCKNRFGFSHEITTQAEDRPFDIPWIVLDSSLAKELWDWFPQISVESILEEIAIHAEKHPDWLEISTGA